MSKFNPNIKWTSVPPNKPGFYWFKSRSEKPTIIELRLCNDGPFKGKLETWWIQSGYSRMNESPGYFSQYGGQWSDSTIEQPEYQDVGSGI